MNVTIARDELKALCERLGHDPNKVHRIIVEPHAVTVEYVHPVFGGPDFVQQVTHRVEED